MENITKNPSLISILYVDDEECLLDIGKKFLERSKLFMVDIAISAKEGLKRIHEKSYDCIISDYQMPDMNGIQFLKLIRKYHNSIPFILFTGRGREEVVIEALNNGATFYLQKGGDPVTQFTELIHIITLSVEKRRIDTNLNAAQQQIVNLINFIPDSIMATNNKGEVIIWNNAMEDLTGIPADQILGKKNYEYSLFLYGQRRPTLIDYFGSSQDEINKYYTDIQIENHSLTGLSHHGFIKGEEKILWCKAAPMIDHEGNISGGVESIRDVTEHVNLQEEIVQNEKKYRTIFENTGTAMAILEEDTKISLVNTQFELLSGYSREDIEGIKSWTEFVIPEEYERMKILHDKRRNNPDNTQNQYEFQFITRSGDIYNILLKISMIPGTKKSVASLIDITGLKEAELSLRMNEMQLETAMDLANMAKWELDCKTKTYIFDDNFYSLYGTTAIDEGGYRMSVDRYFKEFIHPDDLLGVLDHIDKCHHYGPDESFVMEHRVVRRDGEVRNILTRAKHIRDEEGNIIKTFGINQDITNNQAS